MERRKVCSSPVNDYELAHRTCLELRRVTTAVTALEVTQNLSKAAQQLNTAQSCSSGFGSITGVMATGRAAWLCRRSHHRAISLRPGQAFRHRLHLLRTPAEGNRRLTLEIGTATLFPSVSQRPPHIRVVPRPGRAHLPQRQRVLERGQLSNRIRLRQVCLRLNVKMSHTSSSEGDCVFDPYYMPIWHS